MRPTTKTALALVLLVAAALGPAAAARAAGRTRSVLDEHRTLTAGEQPTRQSEAAGEQPTQLATEGAPGPGSDKEMSTPKAVVLGVVEGVTEFLPISSTGHLLITENLLGIGTTNDATKQAADDYAIVIQGGAILAVLVLYWGRVKSAVLGLAGRDPDGRQLLINLVIAFLPAAAIGIVFEKKIKEMLFGPWPVVAAWAVGGLVVVYLARTGVLRPGRDGSAIEALDWRGALVIGCAQVLAMWPGTSRSLVTIVAAVLVGMTLSAAVEFSFLLGLVTLSAATALDGVKGGRHIYENFGAVDPVVGFVAAFIAAVVAVRWMVTYLQRHSMAIFGWYRLGVAILVAALVVAGAVTTS